MAVKAITQTLESVFMRKPNIIADAFMFTDCGAWTAVELWNQVWRQIKDEKDFKPLENYQQMLSYWIILFKCVK